MDELEKIEKEVRQIEILARLQKKDEEHQYDYPFSSKAYESTN